MKKNYFFLCLAVFALSLTSCNKELFDQEQYDELVDNQFMIDNADPKHDWCLTKNDTILVRTTEAIIYKVQVLTKNPYIHTDSEIASEGVCYGNQTGLTYTVPLDQRVIYIAALDQDDNYLGVVPVTMGTKELDLLVSMLQKSTTFTPPTYQTFSYLYESTFPIPDDFDYNDMVVRITKSYTNISTEVLLTVALTAAGTANPYAAAIHLGGVKYDDVLSVEILDGDPMDEGYSFQRSLITQSGTLIKGRNGEAVIRLFEHVHWVFNKQLTDMGAIEGIKYNTSHEVKEHVSAEIDPVVRTFRITCKTREVARSITFDRIDPFLVCNTKYDQVMDAGIWEIHTYQYKFTGILRDCFTDKNAYDNHVSWALVIPKGDFRYPLEGVSMCTYQKEIDATFGPYEGFANWLKNHLANHDWYLHVTREQLLY